MGQNGGHASGPSRDPRNPGTPTLTETPTALPREQMAPPSPQPRRYNPRADTQPWAVPPGSSHVTWAVLRAPTRGPGKGRCHGDLGGPQADWEKPDPTCSQKHHLSHPKESICRQASQWHPCPISPASLWGWKKKWRARLEGLTRVGGQRESWSGCLH